MELWQLKQLQALPLEVKILKTQQRIREWYEHWNGQVYVSFSGGKDSTVLLDLVRELYPEVPAVFVDTGLEYPEIKEFVKGFDNVEILRPEKTFKQVLDEYGYPIISKEVAECVEQARKSYTTGKYIYRVQRLEGTLLTKDGKLSGYNIPHYKYLLDADFKISAKCCLINKKNPIKKYEKRTGRKAFIGMLTDEGALRKQSYLKNGCNAFNSKRPTSNPLGFWTEQDILAYIILKSLRICSVYGEVILEKGKYVLTGLKRTGCMFCMFGVHLEKGENRFQLMKRTHPKIYNYCINDLKCGGRFLIILT